MKYNEFIKYVEIGHEFIGYIDNLEFKLLNIDDDLFTVIIDKQANKYPFDEAKTSIVYKDQTFNDLFKNNLIQLTDMF